MSKNEEIKFKYIDDKYADAVNKYLANDLRAHSLESYKHSIDVANIVLILAKQFKLNKNGTRKLYTAAIMHDIGKLKVPSELLHKKERPTDSEFKILRYGHITGTKEILEKCNFDPDIIEIAYSHHEQIDGNGYPRQKINLSTMDQILIVADLTSAIMMTRSYHKGDSIDKCKQKLQTQLPNKVVAKKFVNAIINVVDTHSPVINQL